MGTTGSWFARVGRQGPRGRGVATLAVAAGLAAAIGALPAGAKAPTGDDAHGSAREHRVTLCHATHSFTNPYVRITVDFHSVTQGGHGRHDGPVFRADLAHDVHWGDIIPPFDLGNGVSYEGKNWTADGQAAFAGGCAIAGHGSTTVPPTTQPSTTVAPSTTAPTTTTPPTTEAPTTTSMPTTTVPPTSTTTSTTATSTTTTAPSTTTTEGPVRESTETTDTVRVLGISVQRPSSTSTTTPVATPTPSAQVLGDTVTRPTSTTGSLPITGGSLALLLAGLALVGGGAVIATMSRARRLA